MGRHRPEHGQADVHRVRHVADRPELDAACGHHAAAYIFVGVDAFSTFVDSYAAVVPRGLKSFWRKFFRCAAFTFRGKSPGGDPSG